MSEKFPEYCPNCVEELKPQKKLLGGIINWLVCSKCGFRKRPEIGNDTANALSDRIKLSNKKQSTNHRLED